jgi:hypothetical protein
LADTAGGTQYQQEETIKVCAGTFGILTLRTGKQNASEFCE